MESALTLGAALLRDTNVRDDDCSSLPVLVRSMVKVSMMNCLVRGRAA